MKRLFDIVVSSSAIAVLSPLLVILALLVRRKLGSPVLFRQVRPGKDAKPFEMLKFRTMTDAHGPGGALLPDSERLTPFGRFLRSTSLDELPELWNVLKGDMSLVGPRPLLRKYLPYYSHRERRRHNVKPGITGYSQINGRNTTPWDQRLEMDVWYVENRNIWIDIKITLATFSKILKRSGLVEDPRSLMDDLDVERVGLLEIRSLTSDEAETAGHLIRQAYDPEMFAHTVIASPGFPRFFRDVQAKIDQVMGLFRAGELAGVFQARERNGNLHLNNFAIRPDEQGWGCADLLLGKFHSLAEGRKTELFVDSRNHAAIRFYLRHGYRKISSVDFRTLELDPCRIIEKPTEAVVAEKDKFERYGFDYLIVTGFSEKLGFVSPGHIIISGECSEDMIESLIGIALVSKITILGNATRIREEVRACHSWTRLTLVRE